MSTLSPHRAQQIADLYNSGLSVDEIAEQLGIAVSTLRCAYLPHIRKIGLTDRREKRGPRPGTYVQKPLSPLEQAILSDINGGMSAKEVEAAYNLSSSEVAAIRARLYRRNLIVHSSHRTRSLRRALLVAESYNLGLPTKDIAAKHGFANANSLGVYLYALRRMGLLTRPPHRGHAPDPNREERYAEVMRLHDTGLKRNEIAKRLGLAPATVSRMVSIELGRRAIEDLRSQPGGLEAVLEGGLE